MKKSVKILLFVLCAVFAGVFLFSGYKLFTIIHGYKSSERQYNNLSNRYVAAAPSATPEAEQEEKQEEVPQEISPIFVDFNELSKECPDIVGWIYSEGTPINYPIVKAGDNDYYLYRDIYGNYSGNGTPFMDMKCRGDFKDYNSVIYGHHMQDGSMFASISNYRKEGYYEEHPVMYLNTPTMDYRVEIFAGYVTDADSNTYTLMFPDTSSFLLYCQEMQAQSNFKTNVEIQPGDTIITLSTCSYEYYDARYVVQGRLVPLGATNSDTAA